MFAGNDKSFISSSRSHRDQRSIAVSFFRFNVQRALVASILAAVGLCSSPATSAPQASNSPSLQSIAGDPLPDLSPEELARFESGLQAYSTPVTIEEGLGPIYNKRFCGACHSQPLGGAGVITVINFGRFSNNTFDPLEHLGGPVLQSEVIPGVDLACGPEDVPNLTNVVTPRLTLGTLGYGLIEAIPEDEILAGADPEDLDNDGIRGIARMVMPREDLGMPGAVEAVAFVREARRVGKDSKSDEFIKRPTPRIPPNHLIYVVGLVGGTAFSLAPRAKREGGGVGPLGFIAGALGFLLVC